MDNVNTELDKHEPEAISSGNSLGSDYSPVMPVYQTLDCNVVPALDAAWKELTDNIMASLGVPADVFKWQK